MPFVVGLGWPGAGVNCFRLL